MQARCGSTTQEPSRKAGAPCAWDGWPSAPFPTSSASPTSPARLGIRTSVHHPLASYVLHLNQPKEFKHSSLWAYSLTPLISHSQSLTECGKLIKNQIAPQLKRTVVITWKSKAEDKDGPCFEVFILVKFGECMVLWTWSWEMHVKLMWPLKGAAKNDVAADPNRCSFRSGTGAIGGRVSRKDPENS